MTDDGVLNIVIPMAGAGSRFRAAGYLDPKPLIPVHGVPMIRVVIDNLRPRRPHRFIFVCQSADVEQYELRAKLDAWSRGCIVIEVAGLTDGAARTVLAAERLIDCESPLMIANSDQYVDISIDEYLRRGDAEETDGLIMTMRASDPKWSFIRRSGSGEVDAVVEKEVVSDEATVGIYNFRRGSDFVRGAKSMISRARTVNGEFYVAPVYNELIENGFRVGTFCVGDVGAGMYGLGTPADLRQFLGLSASLRAVRSSG